MTQMSKTREPTLIGVFPSLAGREEGSCCFKGACRTNCYVIAHRVGRVLSFAQVVGIGTPPTPHPQASVPPLCVWGEGVGLGHTLWYSLFICTLWQSCSDAKHTVNSMYGGDKVIKL